MLTNKAGRGERAGVPVPAQMEGKTVVPLAQAADPAFRKEWYYHYYEFTNESPCNRGIRTEQYKLIHYVAEPQEFELNDLANDPGETKDLYGDPRYVAQQQRLWNSMQELEAVIPERPKIQPKRPG